MSDSKTLRRSRDKIIAGVCGGIAERFGWPADRVRLVYVLVSILSAAFPGTIVYLVLWFLMPAPEGRAGTV
jgi:phage shock protein PspC (stress-responsive transcriptional regulator)